MAEKFHPSFSPARRFGIALNMLLRTALVLAVLVMAVYLSGRYFHRVYLSSSTRNELSPLTVNFIKSITNQVKVTLYFDRDNGLYSDVHSLLKEYRNVNPRISVRTVDYLRDAAEAARVKDAYKLANAQGKDDKDLVIFDCEARVKVINAKTLEEVTIEEVPNEKEREFRRRPIAFRGEMMFTAQLLTVTQPKPMKAMFLTGHGEHGFEDTADVSGYSKFGLTLQQNFITNAPITLLATNSIPEDCNLLIIAGPKKSLGDSELKKIQDYLDEGGRMLVMFNPFNRTNQTGLERLLVRYNLVVHDGGVVDPGRTEDGQGDMIVWDYSPHVMVNPLVGTGLKMILPRPLNKMESQNVAAGAPKVELVAYSSEKAFVAEGSGSKVGRYAVGAVIEKGAVPGVATARGATRILVLGDSFLFANALMDNKWSNRDFAGYAANWLLDRTQLLEGLGPRPVTEYHIMMTHEQMRKSRWLLLGAVPGSVLAFGGLVWLRRRK